MANYILDSTGTNVVICNPERAKRTGIDGKKFRCPFCPGNEIDTPPEIMRLGEGKGTERGWTLRVVPNKFLITDIHEVIAHSPDHEKNIEDFDLNKVKEIVETYQKRFNFLKDKGQVFIFSNFSLPSGASLSHPHSQIIVVPNEVKTKTLKAEPVINLVEQNSSFVAYCPTYSEWPYEVWIRPVQPRRLDVVFGKLDDGQLGDLAEILQSMIKKIKKIHDTTHYSKNPFGYNFYIYPYDNWYLRIIPRFILRAGVELATGIMVNSVTAENAASDLKAITV